MPVMNNLLFKLVLSKGRILTANIDRVPFVVLGHDVLSVHRISD